MRIAPHLLAGHCQKGLAPLYVLYGSEAFLCDESAKLIRASFLAQENCERIVFQCDGASTPWAEIQQAFQSSSLFAASQLIELQIQKLLPSDPAKLLACIENCSFQNIALIQCAPQLKAVHKTKWFEIAEKKGVTIAHYPLSPSQFNFWITARAKEAKLVLSREAIALLNHRTQGNCLAAAQEIAGLELTYSGTHSPITLNELAFQNQYDVFELCEAILHQQRDRIIQILSSLKITQRMPLSLILWVLAQTLRVFIHGKPLSSSEQKNRLLFQMGIRKSSHALYHAAAPRANVTACQHLFSQLSEIDCQLKNGKEGLAWDNTVTVCLAIQDAFTA